MIKAGDLETFRTKLKECEGSEVTVALDLAWTWKERQIIGVLRFVGEDYLTLEEEFNGRVYQVPLEQILYVTPGRDTSP
jgi:hypothetical protein